MICEGCRKEISPDSTSWAIVWDGEKWCRVHYVITMPLGPYHTDCILTELNRRNTPVSGLPGFTTGQRVQSHPSTDTWMSGDRYGTVTTVGRKYVHVTMDRSGRTVKFVPALLLHIDA